MCFGAFIIGANNATQFMSSYVKYYVNDPYLSFGHSIVMHAVYVVLHSANTIHLQRNTYNIHPQAHAQHFNWENIVLKYSHQ